nr:MAG TPA: TBP-associated factor [Caudoviricetes sp.]
MGAPQGHLSYHLCIKQMMFTHGDTRFNQRRLTLLVSIGDCW